ncbi:O-antigen ligase family protein [Roseomonas stagni]|uniref:O-antigen ligase family protein n=1 Tax=Falsiroseomonas algicola TaxID=2716930 RepID=A0A6M1LW53_9PROT|nr:O-antigen ligase family protein [Falsiroseomonas algicola]NGM24202.1 O-antigen ligase family protein [Falsiroseomonas algicola]
MIPLPHRAGLAAIGLLLLGYLLGGRGFAHLGLPPVYVGEVVLVFAGAMFLLSPRIALLLHLPTTWAIMLLCAWCMLRTLPYVETEGMDALRDAAIYGYAGFAILAGAFLAQAAALDAAARAYGRAAYIAIAVMPVVLLLQPTIFEPGSSDFFFVKSGDLGVHLAGLLAFQFLGLRELTLPRRSLGDLAIDIATACSALVCLLWVGSTSRGGLLSVIAAMAVLLALSPRRGRWLGLASLGIAALLAIGLLDVSLGGDRREVSGGQIASNFLSIFNFGASAAQSELVSNIVWRLDWWQAIVEDTLFGDLIWTGHGFGLNLATFYGFQVDVEESLRSPHNGSVTFLARAGVPGLLLWLAVPATLFVGLVRSSRRMRAMGFGGMERLNGWVLAYLAAALVNATFDVYLEGPQGGIWFWSVVGLGLGALSLQREALRPLPADPRAVLPMPAGRRA